MRWEALANGLLLKAAAGSGFDAILCIDKNLEYEQNLKTLPLPVIVLDARTNAVHGLIPFTASLLKLLESPLEKLLYILYMIEKTGNVVCVTAPRPRP
jgi:hypothetical protein